MIARAALCLMAIGDTFGTLSEAALARNFGRTVIGLEGAARADGVVQVSTPEDALLEVARYALAMPCGRDKPALTPCDDGPNPAPH